MWYVEATGTACLSFSREHFHLYINTEQNKSFYAVYTPFWQTSEELNFEHFGPSAKVIIQLNV